MKILILAGKFGMGHMSAARALQEHLEQDGHCAEVVDLFEYAMPEQAPTLYWWFNVLVIYGGVFYNIYHNLTANSGGENRADNLADGLDRLVDDYQPDVVVSTHPVCSAAMARYKEDNASDIPLITCITDVTCHSEWIYPNTDYYLVADEVVLEGLAAKGVDPDIVTVSGIPVSGRFRPVRRDSARPRELLVMGGGLGLMPRRESFYQALNDLAGVHTTVLTGRNDRLFRRLVGKYENVEVIPFTHEVDQYMDRAHLVLSKPGGITSFEAIAARLPMLAWQPFFQQEQENAEYLERHGMARVVYKEDSSCVEVIRETIFDDRALNSMAWAMEKTSAGLERSAVRTVVAELARERGSA